MKRHLITLVKLAISVAIVVYLVMQAKGDAAFSNLRDQPKHWGMLAAAWLACTGAVLLTLIRWHFLVRAVGIPSPFRNTLRIGFVGYLFNLAPMGIVGGDVLKAVMLAREYRQEPVKSLASVVIDRLIGLYLVFVVATVAILATGFWRLPGEAIEIGCQVAFWATGLGALAWVLVFIPALTEGRLAQAACRWPKVGPVLESVLEAVRTYRRRPGVLALAVVLTLGVHSFFAIGLFLISCGLPGEHHLMSTDFVLMPLSAATGAIPLPLGPFEFVLDALYTQVALPSGAFAPVGQGLVLALGYRIITILIAVIGMVYYFSSRQEISEVLQDAAEQPSEPLAPPPSPTLKMNPPHHSPIPVHEPAPPAP
ncbi:MAG: flippase-like domain-containing protein [Pirellulales bacterium]|nr:flippase-like domain-containing protein [Pirellulales bacterium]